MLWIERHTRGLQMERGVPGCHSGEEVGLDDATTGVGPYVGVYCFVGWVQAEGVVACGADSIVYALDADPKLQWGKRLSCLGHHPHVDNARQAQPCFADGDGRGCPAGGVCSKWPLAVQEIVLSDNCECKNGVGKGEVGSETRTGAKNCRLKHLVRAVAFAWRFPLFQVVSNTSCTQLLYLLSLFNTNSRFTTTVSPLQYNAAV
jgi:hypothetical protein